MSPLSILQDNESRFSNWALSSYSVSRRLFTSLVERLWTSSSNLMSFLSHGRQAWNEHSKWGLIKVPCRLSKSVGVVFINDAFMALIIEFALFAKQTRYDMTHICDRYYIRTHVCMFLFSVRKRVFELSRVWPWRWPRGGTPYMVFIDPVFHFTSKTCLKRIGHYGYEWLERNLSVCSGHELANAL